MADTKSVFIAFSMDDEGSRNMFTGQRVHAGTPFEFIDLSVKERYESGWKEKVTTRIRRSDGVIALISKNTPSSEGELWEIATAVAEGKPLLGIWLGDYRTKPSEMGTAPCKIWTWDNVGDFIDSL
ncbi:MAG TPA: TIR domain-containing protein [Candidatus Saccharimonadales bacterium]|jgi:hypothetical protein